MDHRLGLLVVIAALARPEPAEACSPPLYTIPSIVTYPPEGGVIHPLDPVIVQAAGVYGLSVEVLDLGMNRVKGLHEDERMESVTILRPGRPWVPSDYVMRMSWMASEERVVIDRAFKVRLNGEPPAAARIRAWSVVSNPMDTCFDVSTTTTLELEASEDAELLVRVDLFGDPAVPSEIRTHLYSMQALPEVSLTTVFEPTCVEVRTLAPGGASEPVSSCSPTRVDAPSLETGGCACTGDRSRAPGSGLFVFGVMLLALYRRSPVTARTRSNRRQPSRFLDSR